MANVFIIMDTNEMTDNDWLCAKKLDKNDRLIFMVSSSGMIPYQSIPYFCGLKKEPEIYPFADADIYAFSIFVGMQCASIVNGKCYIIEAASQGKDFSDLDGICFKTDKNTINVKLTASLEDAFADKKGSPKKRTIKKETLEKENDKLEDSLARTEISIEENRDTELEVSSDFNSNDFSSENDTSDCPEAFSKKLALLYPSLSKYENEIYESVNESTEGVLSTLEFHLNMRLGEDTGCKVFEQIEKDYEILKELI